MFKFYCVLLINVYACNSDSNNLPDTPAANHVGNIRLYSDSLISGRYRDVSIAVDENQTITGVYEYYDNWDESLKEYLNVNYFAFYGKGITDSVVVIQGGWPNEADSLNGKIIFHNKDGYKYIRIVLDAQPGGYNDVDFTDSNGVVMSLNLAKEWKQIRIIQSSKAKMYSQPDSLLKEKAYLIKNDVVKVLEKKEKWNRVEFNPKNEPQKSILTWIREEDLYPINPLSNK